MLANLKTDIFCALQEASHMFNELSPKTFLYLEQKRIMYGKLLYKSNNFMT